MVLVFNTNKLGISSQLVSLLLYLLLLLLLYYIFFIFYFFINGNLLITPSTTNVHNSVPGWETSQDMPMYIMSQSVLARRSFKVILLYL